MTSSGLQGYSTHVHKPTYTHTHKHIAKNKNKARTLRQRQVDTKAGGEQPGLHSEVQTIQASQLGPIQNINQLIK